jgi:hypothetical protein
MLVAATTALLEGLLLGCFILWLLRVWFFGSLFADRRARAQAGLGVAAELLTCPLCLSTQLCILGSAAIGGIHLGAHLVHGDGLADLLALLAIPAVGGVAHALAFTIFKLQHPGE